MPMRSTSWGNAIYIATLIGLMLGLSGCGLMRFQTIQGETGKRYRASAALGENMSVNLTTIPKKERWDEKIIATVSITQLAADGFRESTAEIRKVKGGYSMELPMYESDILQTHFTISHEKEYQDMLGIRLKWQF